MTAAAAARPLLGPPQVAGPVARGQHRAEADARDADADLSRRNRGQRGIEAGEALGTAAPTHETEAAVGEGQRLEVGVAELDGDRQGPVGAGDQFVDVGAITGEDGELEVAPLDARTDPLEQDPGPFGPALGRGLPAERAGVQARQRGRHAGGLAERAIVPQPLERLLPSADRRHEVRGEVRGEAQQVGGLWRCLDRLGLRGGDLHADEVAGGEGPFGLLEQRSDPVVHAPDATTSGSIDRRCPARTSAPVQRMYQRAVVLTGPAAGSGGDGGRRRSP